MFSGVKLYAGLGVLALLLFVGLYFNHLRVENQKLHTTVTQLEISNKAKGEALEENTRRDKMADAITSEFDKLRAENRNTRDSNNKRIDDKVTAGQDKPVGKLLKDFLNDE